MKKNSKVKYTVVFETSEERWDLVGTFIPNKPHLKTTKILIRLLDEMKKEKS